MEYNDIFQDADNMIDFINKMVTEKLKGVPVLKPAIVSRINENNSVDIYIPPDRDKIFTNISNQTPFELKVGDSVELLLKDGTYSNCWVIAKHKV